MSEIPRPGHKAPDIEASASFGGAGWVGRKESHRDDVDTGGIWHRCGTPTEWAPLKEVVLSWPSDRMMEIEDADAWLMLDCPDIDELRRQTEAVIGFYEACGVKVHVIRSPAPPPPNFLFMRDVFSVSREGALLGRPASRVRAEEARFAAMGLASIGVPLVWMPRGRGTFEGADMLWINPQRVLVGIGCRTNEEGFRQLEMVLRSMGVEATAIPLPTGVQHLLGVVNFVDRDLAVVHADKADPVLLTLLDGLGVDRIELGSSPEVDTGGAMNFVTLEPRRLVMPAGCPDARSRYESAGIRTEELEVSEYLKAAGGLGCLTGILRRGTEGER